MGREGQVAWVVRREESSSLDSYICLMSGVETYDTPRGRERGPGARNRSHTRLHERCTETRVIADPRSARPRNSGAKRGDRSSWDGKGQHAIR